MRDRGVDVVEMHSLLAETVAPRSQQMDSRQPGRVQPGRPGPGRRDQELSRRAQAGELAETLIGGLSTDEFPETHGGEMLKLVKEAAGVTEYLLPPLPNTLYTRDTTCWIYGGVTLNPLYWPARHEETILTTAIYKFHPDFAGKVKVWWGDPTEDHGLATLEGGDVMPIGKGNVLIGMSERPRVRPSARSRRRCSRKARPSGSSWPPCRSCAPPCISTRCLPSPTATACCLSGHRHKIHAYSYRPATSRAGSSCTRTRGRSSRRWPSARA